MQDAFAQRKRSVLDGLEANCGDKSRKGSVDAPIISLIDLINAQPDLFTTSSCSGRVSVFAEPTEATRAAGKKGGEWVFASHERSDPDEVLRSVKERLVTGARLILRFEPFILHAECRDLDTATKLLIAARNSGYRESGATFGSAGARVMVAVRCSLRLEVPVADAGVQLCQDAYVRYLVNLANEKFTANEERVAKLEEQIREVFKEAPQQQQQPYSQQQLHRQRHVTAATRAEGHAAAASAPARPSLPDSRQAGSLEPLKRLLGRQLQLLKRLKAVEKAAAGAGQKAAEGVQKAAGSASAAGGGGSGSISTGDVAKGSVQENGQKASQSDAALLGVQQATAHVLTWEPLPCGLQYNPQNPLQAQAAARQQQQQTQTQRRQQQQKKASKGKSNGAQQADNGDDRLTAETDGGSPPDSPSPANGLADVAQGGGAAPALVPVTEFDSIMRWGHVAVEHKERLVVIGGYGGEGAHMRRADVLVYEQAGGAGSSGAAEGGEWRIVSGSVGKGAAPVARMGHAAVVLGDRALVIGGRTSPTSALGDVWSLDLNTWRWQQLQPRIYPAAPHASSAHATSQPASASELPHQQQQQQWPPRFRHAAATDGSRVYVWGGTDGTHLLDDLWVLEQQEDQQWAWVQVPPNGQQACWPQGRKSHAMAVAAGRLYMHGGMMAYGQHLRDLYCLDLAPVCDWLRSTLGMRTAGAAASLAAQGTAGIAWRLVQPTGNAPPACFSHALTPWAPAPKGPGWLLLTGGHPSHDDRIFAFDVANETWSVVQVQQPPRALGEFVPVRHTATVLRTATASSGLGHANGQHAGSELLVLVGGGAFCFSFGTVFSRPWMLDLQHLVLALQQGQTNKTLPAKAQPEALTRQTQSQGFSMAAASRQGPRAAAPAQPPARAALPQASSTAKAASAGGDAAWVLEVPVSLAKAAKDAVKACGWLDQSRRAGQGASQPTNKQGQGQEEGQAAPTRVVALPLLPLGATAIAIAQQGQGQGQESVALPDGVLAALAGGAVLCKRSLPDSSRCGLDPKQAMRVAAEQVLSQHATGGVPPEETLHEELLADLPTKWERLGDLALIPANSLVHGAWTKVLPDMQPLWKALAEALGVQRLARQAPVANTGTRDSRAILLLGQDGWVAHREGGVTFCLDVTRCMYSSGNVTERLRMGRMDCSGQTVVDLYTGIGYYTLPVLASAGAAKVFACEWNPHAIDALRRNLDVNGVAGRCEIRPGDCRQMAPRGVADRVLLGLLPSSQGGWETAVLALKDSGGWLHVHENVKDSEEAVWVEQAAARFQEIARNLPGRDSWVAMVKHVERVKWYAPHVRHIVVDLELREL